MKILKEVIKSREIFGMGHHIIHLKSGQSIDVKFDYMDKDKESEYIRYYRYIPTHENPHLN